MDPWIRTLEVLNVVRLFCTHTRKILIIYSNAMLECQYILCICAMCVNLLFKHWRKIKNVPPLLMCILKPL